MWEVMDRRALHTELMAKAWEVGAREWGGGVREVMGGEKEKGKREDRLKFTCDSIDGSGASKTSFEVHLTYCAPKPSELPA